MRPAVDVDDDFIDKERIAMALMFTLQSPGELETKPGPWCMAPQFYAALPENPRDGDRNTPVLPATAPATTLSEAVSSPELERESLGAAPRPGRDYWCLS